MVNRRQVGAWLAGMGASSPALAKRGARAQAPAAEVQHVLRAGRYFWMPELAPLGPVVVVVNLRTQLVQVFRNGVVIGFSSTSTGARGRSTPVGLYPVLEKKRMHRSNLYNNAPMPYMLRLTHDGVAMHAGHLPGYPASHGCVRLPMQFASALFGVVGHGDRVAVLNQAVPEPLCIIAPIDAQGLPTLTTQALKQTEFWDAQSDIAAAPISLVISTSQQRLYALCAGHILAAAQLPPDTALLQVAAPGLFTWQGQWLDWASNMPAPLMATVWNKVPAATRARLMPKLAAGVQLWVTDLHAVNDLHAGVWELVSGAPASA